MKEKLGRKKPISTRNEKCSEMGQQAQKQPPILTTHLEASDLIMRNGLERHAHSLVFFVKEKKRFR
jgi:hypothetical protein